MLAGLTLAVAALMIHARRPQWAWLVLALFGLVLGLAARHNALTTAFPLFLLFGAAVVQSVWKKGSPLRWSLRGLSVPLLGAIGIGTLAWFGSLQTVSAINRTATHVPVLSMIQIWDIAAVSVAEKRELLPDYLQVQDHSAPTLDLLRQRFNTTNLLTVGQIVSFAPPPEYEDELTKYWLQVIKTYPEAYLHHRWALFSVMMGWTRAEAYYPFTNGIDPNDMGLSFARLDSAAERRVLDDFAIAARSPFYETWLYAAFLLVLTPIFLVMLLRRRGLDQWGLAVFMLALSGAATWLPLFFFSPAPDFRYMLWPVMASCLGVSVLVAGRAGPAYVGIKRSTSVSAPIPMKSEAQRSPENVPMGTMGTQIGPSPLDVSTVWVVMPAYNEGAVIEQTVRDVLPIFPNIVVVDDCSLDKSGDSAHGAGAVVCRHPVNLGQGAAIQTGIDYAITRGATEIVTLDSDGQHDPTDALNMLRTLRAADVQIVLGSRFKGHAVGISPGKRIFLLAATLYTRLSTGLSLTDTHNGLRVIRQDAAKRLRIRHNRMAHASEILEQIAELRLSYVEAPCTIRYTDYSKAKGQRMSGAFAILSDLIIGRLYK